MTHAVRIHQTGGPDVLRWEVVDLAPPGPGEARVRHTAVGVNFIDTYYRTGLYATKLPTTLGSEAAGVVEEVGEGVTGCRKRRSRRLRDGAARCVRRGAQHPRGDTS